MDDQRITAGGDSRSDEAPVCEREDEIRSRLLIVLVEPLVVPADVGRRADQIGGDVGLCRRIAARPTCVARRGAERSVDVVQLEAVTIDDGLVAAHPHFTQPIAGPRAHRARAELEHRSDADGPVNGVTHLGEIAICEVPERKLAGSNSMAGGQVQERGSAHAGNRAGAEECSAS